MIIAYVSPSNAALRTKVEAAAEGERIAFRDPAMFQPSDADPLDHLVYVGDDAAHIREVYAGLGTPLYSLDDATLKTPEVSFLERRRRQEAARVGQPIDAAAVPNVHGPQLTNPATGRQVRSAADESTDMQRAGRLRGDTGDPLHDAELVAAGENPVQNRLEGVKRVGGQTTTQAREGMGMMTLGQTDVPVPTTEAPSGLVRPNASARAQTTAPEAGAPVVTLQKPANAPMPGTNPLDVGPVVEPALQSLGLRAGQRRSTARGETTAEEQARLQQVTAFTEVPGAQSPFMPQGPVAMSEPTETPKPTGPPTPGEVTPKPPEPPKPTPTEKPKP